MKQNVLSQRTSPLLTLRWEKGTHLRIPSVSSVHFSSNCWLFGGFFGSLVVWHPSTNYHSTGSTVVWRETRCGDHSFGTWFAFDQRSTAETNWSTNDPLSCSARMYIEDYFNIQCLQFFKPCSYLAHLIVEFLIKTDLTVSLHNLSVSAPCPHTASQTRWRWSWCWSLKMRSWIMMMMILPCEMKLNTKLNDRETLNNIPNPIIVISWSHRLRNIQVQLVSRDGGRRCGCHSVRQIWLHVNKDPCSFCRGNN